MRGIDIGGMDLAFPENGEGLRRDVLATVTGLGVFTVTGGLGVPRSRPKRVNRKFSFPTDRGGQSTAI